MDRTRNVTGAVGAPSNRDLTVGLIGAIVSLSVTMYQNMAGNIDDAELLQFMTPIQQLLSRLILRLKKPATPRLTAGTTPRSYGAPSAKPSLSTPRRQYQTQPRQIMTTPKRAVNATRTTGSPSFKIPPGWREISNLDDYFDESSGVELGMGSEGTFDETPMISGFEYSQDMDYYPSMNRNISDLESSDQFQPVHQSTQRQFDDTYSRPSSARLPKRVVELRTPTGSSKRTIQKADGTYAVRETINTTKPDGTFQRITRTVSGPNVSVVQNLSESVAELPSLDRTRTIPDATGAGPTGNVTFDASQTQ